jgi:hypothetical protein
MASAALFGAFSSSCAETARERFRTAVYPPSFQYVSREKVASSMDQLGQDSMRINEILRAPEPLSPAQRTEIVQLLDSMAAAAGQLGDQGRRSNHPLIDANLPRFLRDVAAAKSSALQDPPNYFLAGSVAGGCLYCHTSER